MEIPFRPITLLEMTLSESLVISSEQVVISSQVRCKSNIEPSRADDEVKFPLFAVFCDDALLGESD